MRERRPVSEWTSEVSSAYAMAGFLAVVFAGFTLLVAGPWTSIDAYFNVRNPPPGWVPVLEVLDRVGQRAVCIPILAAATLWAWRRTGRVRQFYVAGAAVLALNFVVGVLKLSLGRGQPGSMNPEFFVGGMAYPSGHAANIVLVYGLIPYVLAHYGVSRPRTLKVWIAIVAVLSAWMVTVSLTLTWHWFGDLWAGLMIGGIVLALTSAIDHSLPRDVFDRGLIPGLRSLPRLLLWDRHRYDVRL